MDDQYTPGRQFLAGLITGILSFCCTFFCFGFTATCIALIHLSSREASFGLLTVFSILSADFVVSLNIAFCMGVVGACLNRRYTTRQMLTPICVVAVCFCAAYCIGEIVFDGPQEKLFYTIERVVRYDGFSISRGLAKELGFFVVILFPLLILTALIDVLLLPIVLLTSSTLHAAFLNLGFYVVLVLVGCTGPSIWISRRLLERQTFNNTLGDDVWDDDASFTP